MPRDTSPYGPLVEIAVAPKRAADRARLLDALTRHADHDIDLAVSSDTESGQIILGGRDEDHLDRTIQTLRAHHFIAFETGTPQIAYRETLTGLVETDYTHKQRSGGIGQFARVILVFAPHAAGSAFESKIAGGAVPEAFVSSVEAGIASVMRSGVLAGFPVVDVKATLIDGAYHDTDSSTHTFEIAARGAFREALGNGRSVLLEPVMNVTVTTPPDVASAIERDLGLRRSAITGHERQADAQIIKARVPLANLFGYGAQIRALSRGQAAFTATFALYAPVPLSGDDDHPPPAASMALR